MRILIIGMNVGRTAGGIVAERLIHGLSSIHQIDVLTANYNPSLDLSRVCNIIISKKSFIHPRIHKLLITFFSVELPDYFWGWKSMRLLKSKKFIQYDIVFSILSYHNYASLIAGARIAREYNCKYAVHTLDAIPAPGWSEDYIYIKGVKRLVAKYLSKADALFSTNNQMLAYQLSTFKYVRNLITNVIYNPSNGEFKEFPFSKCEADYFVYTGGIYRPRTDKYLLEGFEKLLKLYPDSYLIFVGNYWLPSSFQNLNQRTLDRIKVLPFTQELDPYYSCATALIDIDPDVEKDVFLSSKIVNYIMINRIIISETGKNSPSRNLFKNIDSIIQCDHDPDQLFEAMKKSILMKDKIVFDDRKHVLELFYLDNVIRRLNNSLSKLIMQ